MKPVFKSRKLVVMKLVAFVLFIGIFAKQSIAGPLNSMDVIVVQQANGSFVSSPFHVRFGKSDLIAALSKTVSFITAYLSLRC